MILVAQSLRSRSPRALLPANLQPHRLVASQLRFVWTKSMLAARNTEGKPSLHSHKVKPNANRPDATIPVAASLPGPSQLVPLPLLSLPLLRS